ncbi:MAG TPA: hypothetical protein PLL25_08820 [Flavobacteriales bacterium]|jgi:hypothetical protein|nr:hypothetical protein [Flavobacteriales bacterium]
MSERPALHGPVEVWFQGQGFTQVHFSGPIERITTINMGHTLVFKLRELPDHFTFYKEAAGGSLIVFEVTTMSGKVQYTGYCPLLLFGIWERKVSFKADASMLAPYRKEGFEVAQRFKRMLEERGL